MSVSLTVHFDRADRTYGVGEPVTGRVLIETDRGADCLGITLTHAWRAHGLGTTDRNPQPKAYTLHDGPLPDLPSHEIRFAFPAPKEPLTYRGKQFDIEHSLEVQFKLPFRKASLQEAADATVTEGFEVVPGPLGAPPPKDLLRTLSLALAARKSRWTAPVTGPLLINPEALQALSSSLESAANLRRWAAERRIGSVLAFVHSRVISPGETLKVNLRFSPDTPTRINQASLELRGQEVSTFLRADPTAGPGKTKEIKSKALFSTVKRITGPLHLRPEEALVFRTEVQVPHTDAFTFVSAFHLLAWEAVVRVDVPAWPDWVRTFPLVIWPEAPDYTGDPETSEQPVELEVSEEPFEPDVPDQPLETLDVGDEPAAEEWLSWEEAREFAAEEGILGGAEGPPSGEEEQEQLVSEIRSLWETSELGKEVDREEGRKAPKTAGTPEKKNPPDPQAETDSTKGSGLLLAESVQAIREEKIIGGNRDGLIKALKGQSFSFQVTVGRIEKTIGMFSHPDYGSGRTLSGTVAETDIEVAVCCPKGLNEEIDALELGSHYSVRGTVSAWDALRRRPTILAELMERGE